MPSRTQYPHQGVLSRLKVRLSQSLIKITPGLVMLPSKQNYPWEEKNRPRFLEKNQQPKDKTQTEGLMVHGYINGNFAEAPFPLLFLLSQQPSHPPPRNLTAGISLLLLQIFLQ